MALALAFRSSAFALLIAATFALFGLSPSAAEGLQQLTIATASGKHVFQVEIAKNEPEREKGLMFRRFMPADRGMLFEFEADEPVAFWMKNTYIPLDMIFASPQGLVTHVVANAEPLSENVIPSGGPCIAVLELNGGMAAKIGVRVGDRIEAAFFKP